VKLVAFQEQPKNRCCEITQIHHANRTRVRT
jgi:hypothetical protein